MTISIRRTSRAADSPGRYFDRVSLDPYYMHRHRTGRSTSTWVPAGPLLQHLSTPSNHYRPVVLSRAAISSGHHFLRSIRSAGTERHLSTISYRPVDPHNVDSSYFQYFGNFFIIFFVITSASRSDRDLSLFSFSFAPYPVLRSLRLSLTGWYRDHSLFTCLVLFPFVPLYGREPSHTDHHPIFTENQSSFVRYRHSST